MNHIMRANTLSATMLLICVSASAQNSYQLALDTNAGLWRGTVLEDGSTVLALHSEEKTTYWIGNQNGNPQHCFSAQTADPNAAVQITARPGGGFYAVTQSGVEFPDVILNGDDTLIATIKLQGFTSSGAMDICKTYTFVRPGSVFWTTMAFDIDADDQGVYFSAYVFGTISEHRMWMMKTDPAGVPAWCKELNIGIGSFAASDLTCKVEASGDGGMYFANQNFGPSGSNVLVGRLGTDGNLIWANDIEYQTGFSMLSLNDLVVSAGGAPIVVAQLEGLSFRYGYLLSVDPSGNSVQGDFYEIAENTYPAFKSAQPLPDGGMLLTTSANYDAPLRIQLIRIGADMEVIEHALTDVVVNDQMDYSLYPTTIGSVGNQAVIVGSLRNEHEIFGTTGYRPTAWRLDLSGPEGCMLTDSAVAHYPIPSDLLVMTPVEPVIDDFVTLVVLDEPLTTVQETLLSTTDLCELLVGTPELTQAKGSITTYPNPTEAGSTLNIQCENAIRFAFFNATGSLVRNITAASNSDRVTLSCSDLAPGLYSAVAFGKDGQRLASTKVAVQ